MSRIPPDRDPGLFDEILIGIFADRRRYYERAWIKDQIDACLAEPECRIVLVTGDPGAGKTTFMAWLARREPGWLSYFIRRVGDAESGGHYTHEGGLASFLTVIGFQLAALRPDLFPDLQYHEISAELRADTIGQGKQTVLRIDEVVTHQFRRLVLRARATTGKLEGHLTVLDIGKLVVDAATTAPEALAEPALFEPLRRLGPGERVVILLDGLDELRFRDTATDVGRWLAAHPGLPPNLTFVVASRPDDSLARNLLAGHSAAVRQVKIDAASERVRQDTSGFARILAEDPDLLPVLAAHGITAERFTLEMSRKAAGNFQYLGMIERLLEAEASARAKGAPSASNVPGIQADLPDLRWLDDIETLPDNLPGLYAALLWGVHRRIGGTPGTRHDWSLIYRPLLGMLAVQQAPLTAAQVRDFADIQAPVDGVARALERLDFLLRKDDKERYELFHGSMSDFLLDSEATALDQPLHCDAMDCHKRVTQHSLHLHKADHSWKRADTYLRAFLPTHAAEAGMLDELLQDPAFLMAADPVGLVSELGAADQAAPIAQAYQRVVPLLRTEGEASALAHLELYAMQTGLHEFAASVARLGHNAQWLMDFTRWSPGSVLQILGQHASKISAGEDARVAVTHDLDRKPIAVTGDTSGLMRVWDLESAAEATRVSPLPTGTPGAASPAITALAASELSSGEPVAVAGDANGAVRAWNLGTGTLIAGPLIGIENSGRVAATGTMAGSLIAACRIGDQLRAWDLVTGLPLGPPFLMDGAGDAERATITEAGGRPLIAVLAETSTEGGRVQVWDGHTGQPYGPPIRARDEWISAIALADLDGRCLLALADGERGRQVFDAATGAPLTERTEVFDADLVTALAIGVFDGQPLLAEANQAGEIRLRDLSSLRLLGMPVPAHGGEITALAITATAQGAVLLSSGRGLEDPQDENGRQPLIRLWQPDQRLDGGSGRRGRPEGLDLRSTGPLIPLNVLRDSARTITVVRADGRLEIVVSDGLRAYRWDAATGEPVGQAVSYVNSRVNAVAVATIGGAAARTLAVSATYDGRTIRTWDLGAARTAAHPETGRPLIREVADDVRGLAIGRLDGRAVVVCAEWSDIHVWDLATGEPAGPAHIDGPHNILSLAAGAIASRPVIACVSQEGIHVLDLATGAQLDPPYPGAQPGAEIVTIGGPAGHELVVSGSTRRTLQVWSPEWEDPRPIEIKADDFITKLAVVSLRARPVAICSGPSGEVRLVDLADRPAGAGPWPDGSGTGPITHLAASVIHGTPVAVCAGENGVLVLDATTGRPAARVPEEVSLGPIAALAVGELGGRPVAIAAGRACCCWHLDDGEPLTGAPRWPDQVSCLSIARIGDHVIASAGAERDGVHLFDLATGQPLSAPVTDLPEPPMSLILIGVSGVPVLLVRMRGHSLARALRLPGLPEPQVHSYADFMASDDTPPPPLLPQMRRLALPQHSAGWSMAAGPLQGVPIVITGHDHGEIDLLTLGGRLPVIPPLAAPDSPVNVVTYQPIGTRAVLALGLFNGMVLIADLNDLSAQTSIRTLTPVRALALAAPDRCLIGTDNGVISVRVPFLGHVPPTSPAERATIPYDIRAARTCPEHAEHRQLADWGGFSVPRLCLKAVQNSRGRGLKGLRYAAGHCHVLPDRLVITPGAPVGNAAESEPDLVLRLEECYPQPTENPNAHETDGCHFGVAINRPSGPHQVLCCYRRSERDWLLDTIRQLRQGLATRH